MKLRYLVSGAGLKVLQYNIGRRNPDGTWSHKPNEWVSPEEIDFQDATKECNAAHLLKSKRELLEKWGELFNLKEQHYYCADEEVDQKLGEIRALVKQFTGLQEEKPPEGG